MEISRDNSRELTRLEKAARKNSKHFVQCPRCKEWLDLRELGCVKTSWVSSSRMYIAFGLFGSIVMMLIWAALD